MNNNNNKLFFLSGAENPSLSFFNELADKYNKFFSEGNMDELANTYTEDGSIDPMYGPQAKGRKGLP